MGGVVIVPTEKVRVVPAATRVLKKALKKKTELLELIVAPEFINGELVRGSTTKLLVLVGESPLNVSCNDPPAGIEFLLTMV